jgi:signal transduction histidine kinase
MPLSARSRLLAVALIALLLPVQAGAIPVENLGPTTRSIGGLPHVAHEVAGTHLPGTGAFRIDGYAMLPRGSDGRQRMVRNHDTGLVLLAHDGITPLVVDQLNMPAGYTGTAPYLGLAPYATGSAGPDEVAVTARHRDGSHWRVWAADVEQQLLRGDLMLPNFPERRPDGNWDGAYLPKGPLPMAGRATPALLLLCDVGLDVHGRGLLAVDPLAGEVLWRVFVDARFETGGLWIGDLEGDGASEVVVSSRAVNNLHGERLYGASDDSSRVFVFGADGTLRWQRALGGPVCGSRLAVLDLDGDRIAEVVATTSGPEAPRGRMRVYSAGGDLLDEVVLERDGMQHLVTLPAVVDQEAVLVTGGHHQRIHAYSWRDGALREVRRSDQGGGTLVAVDVLDQVPGPELAAIGHSELFILDRELRRQAGVTVIADRRPPTVETWYGDGTTGLLVLADGASPSFAFVKAPRSLHPAWFAGGAAAIASLAGMAWRRRRRPCGLETDPVILRELRLQLLGRLEKGGHEKIGALKSLRRLAWRLEAEAVAHEGGPAAGPARERVDEAVSVVQADAVPRLGELLVLGGRIGVPEHLLAMAHDLLAELTTVLEAASSGEAGYGDLHHQVQGLAEELDAVLQRLRRQVEQHFRSDLAGTVDRVLAAQGDAIMAASVSVTVNPHEAAPAPRVAIDVQDLEFVLDNLVGNAIRAMDGTSQRELRVDWSVSGERLLMTVADTGCGIAPDDWDAIFDEGWSTRPGGGLGLARSRRELATYGGSLRVLKSAPGQGTTFLLILPVAPGSDLVNHSDQ